MGLAIAWLFRPCAYTRWREFPLLTFLAVGLGFGTSSVWFFVWLMVFGPQRKAFIASEAAIAAILVLLVLVYFRRRKSVLSPSMPAAASRSRLWHLPAAAFLCALLAAGIAFTRYSAAGPHGSWDAWGDWNLRARFLYLGGQHWTDVFSPRGTLPHRDYPLLLSASVARCWTYLKSDSQRAPIAIAFLFTFATAGELFCSLSLLRSRSQGLIATTVLLGTPFFLVLGSAQYADVPLAFFFLSTIVLLCWRDHENSHGLVLAGAMAGLATWTKNEGELFLLCLLVSHLAITIHTRGMKEYTRELRSLAAGLLPVLAVVAFFKIRFEWHTGLLTMQGSLHRLGSAARYRVLLASVWDGFLHFGTWTLSIPPFLLVYALLLGLQKPKAYRTAQIGVATISLTAFGYFLVYLTTQVRLSWLLATSLTRLYIQLYPSALFLFFLFARTPEEALSRTLA